MKIEDIPKMVKHLGRILFGKAPMATPVSLTGKKIIVTGASPGSIGFETAKTLAQWGATVIITTRKEPEATVQALKASLQNNVRDNNAASGDAASGDAACADIHGYCLDLTNAASVNAFADKYLTQFDNTLDILINNAGIHLDLMSQWQHPNLTEDGFEIHWRTNYLGTAMLTDRLLPALRSAGKKHGDARVINVSSHLHSRGMNREFFSPERPYDSWSAYGQSKLAIVHHAFELHRQNAATHHVKGYALHPGAIATNISGKGLEGTGILHTLRGIFAPIEAMILLSPTQGAQTQILCATDPHIEGGRYYERCEPSTVNPEANDQTAAKRLWNETQQWVNRMTSTAPTC